ncbi:glycosyl hydrolase family 28-related protein [Paenibacillus sp. YN15]|uniref:glycosyl hydrolase family 28-related protein n=1 Tax=Paenibacillus sp. YN15 TaxID=1742774 RepID=UPI000DCCA0E8|nr:glycosyl hydrolase family 28-related protein [Paenibacillus sp. YN15]RAV00187.1 hypothetical protein DQG13_14630 [Paenibacillus sp. YN15]
MKMVLKRRGTIRTLLLLPLVAALALGSFGPWTAAGTAKAEAPQTEPPVVLHATWQAEPGQVVGIYGGGFAAGGGSLSVKAQPLSAGGPVDVSNATVRLTVLNVQDNLVQAVLPETSPADAYAVWVETEADASAPFWLNRAEPFWLSDTVAYPGQTVRVFGRNFLNPVSESVYSQQAFLVDTASGSRINLQVTAADAYTMDVVIPAAAVGGIYRMGVANGAGGEAGAVVLDNDQTLSVIAGNEHSAALEGELGLSVYWLTEIPHDRRFNVRSFGATGDGVTDDTYGIQAALDAADAAGGGIVYLPEGAYSFSSVWIHDRTILLGEGQDKTTLVYNGIPAPDYPRSILPRSAYTSGNYGEANKLLYSDGVYSGIAGLSIESAVVRPQTDTKRRIHGYVVPIAFMGVAKADQQYGSLPVPDSSPGYFVKDVALRVADGSGAAVYSTGISIVENSELDVTHGGLEAGGSKLFRFRGNTVQNTMRPAAYIPSARAWFEGNTLTGVDYETYWPRIGFRFNESGGAIEHRYADFGTMENYVAANHTLGVFGSAAGNEGEGFLWQSTNRLLYSAVTSAQSQSLSDTAAAYSNSYIGKTVTILGGNGMGQIRTITGFSGNTLLLDRPWDIAPSAGSPYTVDERPARHNIVTGNQLDGQTNKGGIMFYTKDYDNIVDGNTLTHTGGVWLGVNQNPSQQRADYSYFTVVKNNILTGSSKPGHGQGNTLAIGPGSDGGIEAQPNAVFPSTGLYGTEIRGNRLTSIGTDVPYSGSFQQRYVTRSGIVVSTPGAISYPMAQGVIVEGNRVRDAYAGVHLADSSYDTVLADNDFDGNRTAYADSGSIRTTWVRNGQAGLYMPLGTAALGLDGTARLSWAPVAGAEGYTVSRSLYEEGPYELLGSTANTSYIDVNAAGLPYYYQLQAYNDDDAGVPYTTRAKMELVQAGAYDTPGRAFKIAVSGGVAYVADQGSIRVLDVAQPDSVQELGSVTLNGNTAALALSGNRLYATDSARLYVLDVSDPAAPVILGSTAVTNGSNIRVSGDMVYVARGTNGFSIYNTANPASIAAVKTVSGLGNVSNLEVQGNYAYVTAGVEDP